MKRFDAGRMMLVLSTSSANVSARLLAQSIREAGDSHEEVRVEVPVSLVDAFLSGEGEEGNIQAAVAELQKRRGDAEASTSRTPSGNSIISRPTAP